MARLSVVPVCFEKIDGIKWKPAYFFSRKARFSSPEFRVWICKWRKLKKIYDRKVLLLVRWPYPTGG